MHATAVCYCAVKKLAADVYVAPAPLLKLVVKSNPLLKCPPPVEGIWLKPPATLIALLTNDDCELPALPTSVTD